MEEVNWNNDPEWVEYILSLTPVIQAMAAKYTTCESLREDCVNQALMELLKIFPQESNFYKEFEQGLLSEEKWKKQLDRYCRQIARNEIFTYLSAIKTGNWYIGRKKRVVDPVTKEVYYTREGARYASMEELEEHHGIQIDADKNILKPKDQINWGNAATVEDWFKSDRRYD